MDQMLEYLIRGDIILDASLDNIEELRYRQAQLGEEGITFINIYVPKEFGRDMSVSYSVIEHETNRKVLDIIESCILTRT